MIAVLDLDDSILDLETPLSEVFPSIKTMTIEERYLNRPKILKAIFEYDLFERAKPLPKAIEFLNALRQNDIQIVFITARSWHPNAYNISLNNLRSSEIYFDELIICGLREDKGDFLNKNDRYILSLEDKPHNHINLKERGVEKPYCRVTPAFDYKKIPEEELIRCHSEISI